MRKLIRTAGIAVGTSAVGLLLSTGPVFGQTGSGSGSGSGATTTSSTPAGGGDTTTTALDLGGGGVGGTDDTLPPTGPPQVSGPDAMLLIGAGGMLGTALGARFLLRRRQATV